MNFVAAATSPLPGWGTPGRIEALEYVVAAFLVAQSRVQDSDGGWGRDFFGFNHQAVASTNGCSGNRWQDCSSNWTEVQAVYARDYGTPLTDAVEVGGEGSGRYFRPYTRVNITFDCGRHAKASATYTWL